MEVSLWVERWPCTNLPFNLALSFGSSELPLQEPDLTTDGLELGSVFRAQHSLTLNFQLPHPRLQERFSFLGLGCRRLRFNVSCLGFHFGGFLSLILSFFLRFFSFVLFGYLSPSVLLSMVVPRAEVWVLLYHPKVVANIWHPGRASLSGATYDCN